MVNKVNPACKKCGKELIKFDYKKRGAISLLSSIPMAFILIYIFEATTVATLYILFSVIIGLIYLLKKEKYCYRCKNCVLKFERHEVEHNNQVKERPDIIQANPEG